MYNTLVMAHSGWRYIVLVVVIVAIVKYLVGWLTNREWTNLDTTLNRVTPIVFDIQWLLGIVVWLTGAWWNAGFSNPAAWEHPIVLTLAVVAAHVTAARARKAETSKGKHQTAAIGYIIALALVGLGVSRVLGSWNLFGMN